MMRFPCLWFLVKHLTVPPSTTTDTVEKTHKPSFRDTLLRDSTQKHFSHFDEFDKLFHEDTYDKGPDSIEGVLIIYITKEEHRKLCTPLKKW